MKNGTKWILDKFNLPKRGERVLLVLPNDNVIIGYLDWECGNYWWADDNDNTFADVKAWAELPEFKNEEIKNDKSE